MGKISRFMLQKILIDNIRTIKTIEELQDILGYAASLNERKEYLESQYTKLENISREISFLNSQIECGDYVSKEELKNSMADIWEKIRSLYPQSNIPVVKDNSSELNQLKIQNSELEKKCQQLENNHAQMEDAIRDLRRSNSELEKSNIELQEKNKNLVDICIALKTSIIEIKKELKDSREENKKEVLVQKSETVVNPVVPHFINSPATKSTASTVSQTIDRMSGNKKIYENTEIDKQSKIVQEKEEQRVKNVESEKKLDDNFLSLFVLTENVNKVLLKNESSKDHVEAYLERFRKTDDIEKYLTENEEYENFSIHKKKIKKHTDSINKAIEKVHSDYEKYSNNQISERVIACMLSKVADNIIGSMIPSVSKRIESKRDPMFINLLNLINVYLESIGVYTYNEAKVGENMDSYMDYYSVTPMITSDSGLYGKIQKISVLPYIINYYDSNNQVDKIIIKEGTMSVYSEEG